MSERQDQLALTLERVAQRTGIDLQTLRGLVERVDVHESRGVTLELCGSNQEGAQARVWFRGDCRSVVRLEPNRDDKLPIASRLAPGEIPLAWRPGRRMVLDHGDPQLIRKGYRKGRVERSRVAHDLFFRATANTNFGIVTPRIVDVDVERAEIVFERLQGHSVQIVSESGDFFFALGEGLAHAQSVLLDADLPVFGVEDELVVLEAWSGKVLMARGQLPDAWRELADVVREAAQSLGPGIHVATHRDLHDGQLIDIDGRPGLIDFDLACRADAFVDPANLLAHLELRLLQGLSRATRSGVDACAEALLEGFGGPQGEAWPRLRFYQATAFLRLALVYAVRPRWQHLSHSLVAFAKRCLEDLVRIA